MFPTELEIALQQKEMIRAAQQYRLIKSLQQEAGYVTLWQRVRARLSARPSAPAVAHIRGSVQPQTEAIA